jgi:glycosyltransferase involved in cell wall biosynthesis
VEDCIKELNEEGYKLKGIFIGRGPLEPSSEVCAFRGHVPHENLPIWLNAADVFCLPTKAEGNCNAINEAMSVGLVTVTSDIPDVSHQVFEYTGKVLVDPYCFESIKQGLKTGLLMSENIRKEDNASSNKVITRGAEIASLIRKMLARTSDEGIKESG